MLLEIPDLIPLAVAFALFLVSYRLGSFLKAKTRKLNVDAAYTENELERVKKN